MLLFYIDCAEKDRNIFTKQYAVRATDAHAAQRQACSPGETWKSSVFQQHTQSQSL